MLDAEDARLLVRGKSLSTGGLVVTVPNFFKEGPTIDWRCRFLHRPFTVYTVLFCLSCVWNIVFEGMGTFKSMKVWLQLISSFWPERHHYWILLMIAWSGVLVVGWFFKTSCDT